MFVGPNPYRNTSAALFNYTNRTITPIPDNLLQFVLDTAPIEEQVLEVPVQVLTDLFGVPLAVAQAATPSNAPTPSPAPTEQPSAPVPSPTTAPVAPPQTPAVFPAVGTVAAPLPPAPVALSPQQAAPAGPVVFQPPGVVPAQPAQYPAPQVGIPGAQWARFAPPGVVVDEQGGTVSTAPPPAVDPSNVVQVDDQGGSIVQVPPQQWAPPVQGNVVQVDDQGGTIGQL
jgi:hypothetical protein